MSEKSIKVLYKDSKRNICVVGDDAQSIYAFRGATIENIFQFQKDFDDLRVYKLEQNYRSTESIVQAANDVIKFNKRQITKKIWTNENTGQKIKLIKAMSDSEEGRRVTDTIIEYKNRYRLSNKHIAILYRTNAQSRILEENLRRYNIPYKIYGGLSFYQRKEIKDLIAYFRLTVNPKDDEAWKRIINFPKRGLGKTTLEKISSYADEHSISLVEAMTKVELSSRVKGIIAGFIELMSSCQKMARTENAYEAAAHIFKKSGIKEVYKDNTIEGLNRLENINALLDGVQEFTQNDEYQEGVENSDDRTLASYLQNIALLTDQDEVIEDNDFVSMMSIHAAKGLEFRSVFVVGMEENLFPSFMSMSTLEGIEEERRLFYVAITRAEKYLTLSYANNRYHFGQIRFNDPSRFLEEISPEYFEMPISKKATFVDQRPKILGNFKQLAPSRSMEPVVAPETFAPSPSASIREGMDVLHLKFGEGKVVTIDGSPNNRIATIFFKDISNPQRRIMLNYAKLQILN
jgi:DNA helicase-2/ATP-dependent DNA helicase PcrA